MKKIFNTRPYSAQDEDGNFTEIVHIFEFENEDELDDFPILSHNEQLSMCGFKEEKTPIAGTIHRYLIDYSDFTVVVRENIYSY